MAHQKLVDNETGFFVGITEKPNPFGKRTRRFRWLTFLQPLSQTIERLITCSFHPLQINNEPLLLYNNTQKAIMVKYDVEKVLSFTKDQSISVVDFIGLVWQQNILETINQIKLLPENLAMNSKVVIFSSGGSLTSEKASIFDLHYGHDFKKYTTDYFDMRSLLSDVMQSSIPEHIVQEYPYFFAKKSSIPNFNCPKLKRLLRTNSAYSTMTDLYYPQSHAAFWNAVSGIFTNSFNSKLLRIIYICTLQTIKN